MVDWLVEAGQKRELSLYVKGIRAVKLISAMKKLSEHTVKIAIHTDGLKNTYPFGLDVFHKFMCSVNGQSTKIVFTGNNASQLSPGNSRLTF